MHYTANIYSEITVKTHVKTVNLKYSGLLYHAQLFTIQSTMPKCRWYSKSLYFRFTVFPLHLEQQLNVKKYSGITVNLITVVYCTVYTFFPCGPYFAVQGTIPLGPCKIFIPQNPGNKKIIFPGGCPLGVQKYGFSKNS